MIFSFKIRSHNIANTGLLKTTQVDGVHDSQLALNKHIHCCFNTISIWCFHFTRRKFHKSDDEIFECMFYHFLVRPKKSPVSGLRAPAFLVFFCFAMKRCSIATNIAWSFAPIWAASLSHHVVLWEIPITAYTSITAPILKPNYDQKPDPFFGLNAIGHTTKICWGYFLICTKYWWIIIQTHFNKSL